MHAKIRDIGAGAAGSDTFCPKPEPLRSFTRSRSRSRNTTMEPEPPKIVSVQHLSLIPFFLLNKDSVSGGIYS